MSRRPTQDEHADRSVGIVDEQPSAEPLDLRLAPVALTAWLTSAAAVGLTVSQSLVAAVLLVGAAAGLLLVCRGRPVGAGRAVAVGCLVTASAAGIVSAGQVSAHRQGPLPDLASSRAYVSFVLSVRSDPREKHGQFAPYVVMRAVVTEVTGRGLTTQVRSPVLVIADPSWLALHLGQRVRGAGRLAPPNGSDLAAVVLASGPPRVLASAGLLLRGAESYRKAIASSVQPLGPDERALVPALVDGDDSVVSDELAADFRTTGLTHLLAVSGSNLTLVVGFVLLCARWAGVRARMQTLVAVLAVGGFVLVARPDPSVLRAAAMGLVSVVGLSLGGARRGVRALCLAVLVLVLVDPWLARSAGFILSSVATGGILVFAPTWRDRLARWLPRWLAEAVAVPLAAQVVCTPVVAAISGQVSVVSVGANLLAGPAVGPATVLGLLGGGAGLLAPVLGHLVGVVAGVPAGWIVQVAIHGAALPGASLGWPVDLVGIGLLVMACGVAALSLSRLLASRAACLVAAGCLTLLVVRPLSGWPPDGWVLAACDIGQGDGLVLNAGHGAAVVVDTGPDPVLMDRCLDRLHVDQIPLVVLTHFHADHVDGLPGVLQGRPVGEIDVSPYPEPTAGVDLVDQVAGAAGIEVRTPVTSETRRIGDVSIQVIGPVDPRPPDSADPNDASIVLMATVHNVQILLSGDAAVEEEDEVLSAGVDLRCDVYKVAHHGSAHFDPAFVGATGASVALISVGLDNDYGHPSPRVLAALRSRGIPYRRTDLDGTVLVVDRGGQLSTVTSR